MRSGGLIALARFFVADAIRSFGLLVARICAALADAIEPNVPASIEPAPEWRPRLWARTGGRTANESRD